MINIDVSFIRKDKILFGNIEIVEMLKIYNIKNFQNFDVLLIIIVSL